MALLALCHLRVAVCGRIAHNHGHFWQTHSLRGKPTFSAEVDLMPTLAVDRVNDDGLQDAVLANVFGKFGQLGLGNLGAWVLRVCEQVAHRQHQGLSGDTLCRRFRRHHLVGRSITLQQIKLKMARVFAQHTHARIVLLLCKKR
jgi:hypothetical protein